MGANQPATACVFYVWYPPTAVLAVACRPVWQGRRALRSWATRECRCYSRLGGQSIKDSNAALASYAASGRKARQRPSLKRSVAGLNSDDRGARDPDESFLRNR